MTKPYILPYKRGSKSAKALAEALGCKRLKLEGSKFIHRPTRCVVNWGLNNPALITQLVNPDGLALNCQINFGELLVNKATNKLKFFNLMNQYLPGSIPEYTTDKVIAQQWASEGHTVVCRKLLNASSGRGITLAEGVLEDVVDAPLYTQYKKKKDEYRVHVFCGGVIDIQRKMRKADVPDEDVDWGIRNLEGGFIFGRNDIKPPEGIEELAISCINRIGLDFGAVDVIYNERDNKCYLLEVNSAPGIQNTTLDKYVEAITKFCQE